MQACNLSTRKSIELGLRRAVVAGPAPAPPPPMRLPRLLTDNAGDYAPAPESGHTGQVYKLLHRRTRTEPGAKTAHTRGETLMRAFSESRAVTALSTPQLQGEGPVVLLSDLWAQDAAIPILHSRAVCVSRCLFRIFPSRPSLRPRATMTKTFTQPTRVTTAKKALASRGRGCRHALLGGERASACARAPDD
jgi:hypothetical protein